MANADIPNHPFRILVVDDNEAWRRCVCSTLKTRPELRVVGEASDGLEAVRMAKQLKPDMILLDVGIPNLNGIEAHRQILQRVPGAKILFLSGNNDPEVVGAALSNGASGYVLKTRAASELIPAVAAVLGGDHFVSNAIEFDL